MARVQRGNVQYTVSAEMVEQFLKDGFDEIDESGQVIRVSAQTTDEKVKITALESEIEDLKSENKKLRKELKAALETKEPQA